MELLVIRIISLIIIVGILINIQKISVKDKKSRSKKKFIVCLPSIYIGVLKWCAWGFAVLLIFSYFYNAIKFNIYDEVFLYSTIGVSTCFGVLCMVLKRWRLQVVDEELIYYTPFIRKKKTNFHELDLVKKTPHGSYLLQVNGKRFGMLNVDFVGKENFLERCEMENIPIIPSSNHTLTKAFLFYYTIQPMFIGCGVFTLFFLILAIFTRYDAILDSLLFSITPFFFLVPVSFFPLSGIMNISKQEKLLNFSFADEMRLKDIKEPMFMDEIWFIHIAQTRVIAFRRDYIHSIHDIKADYQDEMLQHEAKLQVMDGSTLTIKAPKSVLKNLSDWIKNN